MVDDIIQRLKDYLSENKLKIKEISMPKSIEDIKSDYSSLAGFYIDCFNEFRRLFLSCRIEGVIVFLDTHNKLFTNVNALSAYKKSDCEFGKSRKKKLLENFVIDKENDGKNYFDIVDFIDFFLDIRGDDDTLGEGRLKKPYTLKKEDGKK